MTGNSIDITRRASKYRQFPDEMKALDNWVLWNIKQRRKKDGTLKHDKIPLQPNGQGAESNNPETWVTFQEALNAYKTGKFKGLGFMFTKESGLLFLDFDECFPLSEEIEQLFLDSQTLTEHSQSCAGLHLIGKGIKTFRLCKFEDVKKYPILSELQCKGIEVYDSGRFCALTGNFRNEQKKLADITKLTTQLYDNIINSQPQQAARVTKTQTPYKPLAGDDAAYRETVIGILEKYGSGLFDTEGEFTRLLFAWKHEGLDYTRFDGIVKNSQNYDADENVKRWAKAKPDGSLTFGTIHEYARQANSAELEQRIKALYPKREQPPHPADVADAQSAGPDEPVERDAPPPEGTTAEKPEEHTSEKGLPEWAFWTYRAGYGGQITIELSASKYLSFLAAQSFRVFKKWGDVVIVRETEQGFEYTETRGRVNVDVKQTVNQILTENNFLNVADVLLLQGKFYSLELLEMLPDVDLEKVKYSLFSELNTEVRFDTEVKEENDLIIYHDGDRRSPLLTYDYYMGVSAFSGVGKSQFCELIASLAIAPNCDPFSPIEVHAPEGKIVWYDTERSTADCKKAIQRIKERTQASRPENRHLLSEDGNTFKRLEIRGLRGVQGKKAFILEHLESIQEPIALVIIDGALSLVSSMNAEQEASSLIEELEIITQKKECGILITIHANSNKDSTGSGMGHVGKAIERGSSSFLYLREEKNDENRDIKRLTSDNASAKARNARKSGIDAFFEWNETDGMCRFIDYVPPDVPGRDTLKDAVKTVLDVIFEKHPNGLGYAELIRQYAEKSGKAEKTAKSHITKANKWGIVANDNGLWKLDSYQLKLSLD